MAAGDVEVAVTTNNSRACAVFDGVDDEVNANAATLATDRDFSFSLDFKAIGDGGIQDSNIFSFRPSSLRGIGIGLNEGNGKIELRLRNDATIKTITSTTTTNNTWLNVIVTYNLSSNIARMYINGIQQGVDTDGILTIESVGTEIGGNNILSGTSKYFKGAIANVRLYDGKTLSEAEVASVAVGQEIIEGLTNIWKLHKDYKDSIGSADGTNNGTRLSIVDDNIAATISAARTSANDNYMMVGLPGGQVLSGVVEEA